MWRRTSCFLRAKRTSHHPRINYRHSKNKRNSFPKSRCKPSYGNRHRRFRPLKRWRSKRIDLITFAIYAHNCRNGFQRRRQQCHQIDLRKSSENRTDNEIEISLIRFKKQDARFKTKKISECTILKNYFFGSDQFH